MSKEIGIVMSLYDKGSPALKTIGNNTKAFDKNLRELEQACKSYEKSQESLSKDISILKMRSLSDILTLEHSEHPFSLRPARRRRGRL